MSKSDVMAVCYDFAMLQFCGDIGSDEYTGDITYERETLYYWMSDSRGNGYYVAAGDMPMRPAPWTPRGRR